MILLEINVIFNFFPERDWQACLQIFFFSATWSHCEILDLENNELAQIC